MDVLIRDEKDTDYGVISDVTKSAFESMGISNHTEQFIIEALRSAKALTVSLVAEVDGLVVGHIAFSPVTVTNGTKGWFMRAFPEKCSLLFHLRGTFHRARSCFIRASKQTATKALQRMASRHR